MYTMHFDNITPVDHTNLSQTLPSNPSPNLISPSFLSSSPTESSERLHVSAQVKGYPLEHEQPRRGHTLEEN